MRRAASLMIAIVLVLIALGIVMLYSTSSARSAVPHFYLYRQLLWLCLSIIAGTVVAKLDYHHWRRFAIPLVIITLVLLVLVFVPGIGTRVNGSFRWLKLGPIRFQPSELAKLASIVGLAAWMSRFGRQAQEFRMGLLYPFMGLCCIIGLVFLEPDFGTTFVTTVVGMAIMFVGGTKFSYLLASGVAGLTAFSVAIMQSTERLERILAFLWPDKYPDQAYHLAQSKIAFIMGGPFGVGLGNSMQKHSYLPEAHTDFILSIIAEELGFVATTLVVLLFVGFFVCGLTISSRATEPFGRLLGFGVTLMIGLQAAINIGVVTGCLPTKGLPLPFISYGGSSLMISVVMCSVLLSIAQHTEEDDGKTTRSIKDRAHRL